MDTKTKFHYNKRKREGQDIKSKLPLFVQSSIENLFNKHRTYSTNAHDWLSNKCLHSVGDTLQERWNVKKFMGLKHELNDLKRSLNDKDMLTWHAHTRAVNLASKIAPEIRNRLRPELCTQAWCKFYEIASHFLEIQKDAPLFTVHLCEAPGAFVTSLNHFLVTLGYHLNWQWLATTLNPYHEGNNIGEMIDEDRFIRATLDNWYFGEDQTGNLMKQENLMGLKNRLADVHVDLVTADGSIDCQFDPAEQENVVSRLQHCEVITALHVLGEGGTLFVKMFTLFECTSICLMYLMNNTFEKVSVFKPCTSKGGNSEVYVIATGYKGRGSCQELLTKITPWYFGKEDPAGCLFPMSSIPHEFLEHHSEIVEYFTQAQMAAIQRNLDLYPGSSEVTNEVTRSRLELEQSYCAECFFNRYDIKPLHNQYRIMRLPKKCGGASKRQQFGEKVKLEGKFVGSFHERQQLSVLPWKQRLVTMETYEQNVEMEDNSLWIRCMQGEITEEDILSCRPLTGMPVTQIRSSKFCKGFFLARAREIVDNTQNMDVYHELGEECVSLVTTKLILALNASLCYLGNTFICEIHTESNPESITSMCNAGCIGRLEQTNPHQKSLCKDENKGNSDSDFKQTNTNNFIEIKTNLVQLDNSANLCENETKSEDVCDKIIQCQGQNGCQCQGQNGCQCQGQNGCQGQKSELEVELSDFGKRVRHKEHEIECANLYVNKSEIRADEEEMTLNNGGGESASVGQPLFTASYHVDGDTAYMSHVLQRMAKETAQGNSRNQVHLYPACCVDVSDSFEIGDQLQLYGVVQHILENTRVGESVVIEIGLCLTRFTAGLVYILYRSFSEVGFVHCHGQLLRRHLVCLNYRHCPISLQQYLSDIGHMIHPDQSETLLEIIPMLNLLQDAHFTSFLETANINLFQSFITSVVNKERQLQLLQTGL